MTRTTGPERAVMCNLINTHTHTQEKQLSGLIPHYTYFLLPLAMSTCCEVGSDVHALIKELAIRRVKHRSETHSNDSQHLAEGTEVARLRRRFSFVLQQAHLFGTRHHLCRQGVGVASIRQLCSQGVVSVQMNRTEGVTRSERREGANGVGGEVGVGGGNGGGDGVGGGNGDVDGHGDGDGAEVGTGTGVEMNEGAQDVNGDGSGDGSEAHSGDGNGNEDDGNGNADRIGRAEEMRRSARNRKAVVDAMWETGETWVKRENM